MARKEKPSAAETAAGLPDPAATNFITATIGLGQAADKISHNVSLRAHPTRKDFWLAQLDGHGPFPIRKTKLLSLHRFRNILGHHLQFLENGTALADAMRIPDSEWPAIVEAALRAVEGGDA